VVTASDDFSDVTVIMVTHNSGRVLPRTLPALTGLRHIRIFDNASTDGTSEVAARLLPHAHITASSRNLGFGRGNNEALLEVVTPFAILLNPDCILDPRALHALLAAAARYPDAALLSPRLYNESGRAETCYKRAYWEHDRHAAYVDPAGDVCSDFLPGAALLLRMQAVRPIGFFDPWFFIYYEDEDLCLRARRAGLSLVLVHDAVMTHFVGSSSTPSARQAYRKYFFQTLSLLYIERKYRGRGACLRTAAAVLLENLPKLVGFMLLLNRRMVVRSLGRLAGLAAAPRRLARPFSGDPA
jgi:N-acetylglucosaminyl-diphospho-decaprenol L-rhamnosyltransferase